MPTIGSRIRSRREEPGLSQEELGNKLGYKSRSSINKIELDQRNLTQSKIKAIADALSTTPAYIMGWESKDQPPIPTSPNIHPLPAMKQWKVLGGTACGQPLFKPLEDASVLAPADIDADFVFQCVGDSMINARIFDGDIVFIKEDEVPDGQIGVVRIGEEYTLKRIYHGTDYLELRSENPMYPPIIIRGEQENAEIVGRAVQFLSRVI